MSTTSYFYDKNAQELCKQYHSVRFEDVHSPWEKYWPIRDDKVLDVGAGCGRDAKWMAEQGAEVIALEPSPKMVDLGKTYTGNNVTWLHDQLPSLKKVESLGIRFNVILVSAVWMHIAPTNRARAFRKLSNLLAPNGKLIISLRHGPFNDDRVGYEVSVEELECLAKDTALLVKDVFDSSDTMNRKEVSWETVVLSLPDDGSGDLNKVRHIIVNDNKVSTYKLALLRVLLRIADAHPGCVMDRTDGKVTIPMGLVALYWIKAYKRLVDHGNLQQNSNTNKGLTFVTSGGWDKLKHLSADDLAVGSLFVGDEAKALQRTIQASIKAMKEGPIDRIYTGDYKDKNKEFSTLPPKKRRAVHSSVYLDSDFFESYGALVIKESLWECFRLYNSWIEPLVVNQWVMKMKGFKSNQENEVSLQTYHDSLIWLDKDHDTSEVRKRVLELQQQHKTLSSVWSNTALARGYQVDHCLPFAYWPNNDKWNLLPATSNENLSKRDRVPSKPRLHDSKPRILDWWRLAWGEEDGLEQRFFTEASLSLPNIAPQCHDFEEVFEAMGLQIQGVRSRLLVGEW